MQYEQNNQENQKFENIFKDENEFINNISNQLIKKSKPAIFFELNKDNVAVKFNESFSKLVFEYLNTWVIDEEKSELLIYENSLVNLNKLITQGKKHPIGIAALNVIENLKNFSLNLANNLFDVNNKDNLITFIETIENKLHIFTGNNNLNDKLINHNADVFISRYCYNNKFYLEINLNLIQGFLDINPKEIVFDPNDLSFLFNDHRPSMLIHTKTKTVVASNEPMLNLISLKDIEEYSCQGLFKDIAVDFNDDLGFVPWNEFLKIKQNKNKSLALVVNINDDKSNNMRLMLQHGKIKNREYVKLTYFANRKFIDEFFGVIINPDYTEQELLESLNNQERKCFLYDLTNDKIKLNSKINDEIYNVIDLLPEFSKDDILDNIKLWVNKIYDENDLDKIDTTDQYSSRLNISYNKLKFYAGAKYDWHAVSGGEVNLFELFNIYYAECNNIEYIYIELDTNCAIPKPYIKTNIEENLKQKFIDVLQDNKPSMLVDINNIEVVLINNKMKTLVTKTQKNLGYKSKPEHGIHSSRQLVQNWLFTSTTTERINSVEMLGYAYKNLFVLNDVNPEISSLISKNNSNRLAIDNGQELDFNDDLSLILEDGYVSVDRTLGCDFFETPFVTINLVTIDGKNYAKLEYDIIPLFVPKYLQPEMHIKVTETLYNKLNEQTTPSLIADPNTGVIISCNKRMLTKFDDYDEYLRNNKTQTKYHLLGYKPHGFRFYERIREYFGVENFNPILNWDKQSTISYQINDYDLNQNNERYISNCFNQSLNVTVEPIEEDGKVFALCSFTPLSPQKQPKQNYTPQEGMFEWKTLLEQRQLRGIKSEDLASLNIKDSLNLLNNYYQSSETFALFFNNDVKSKQYKYMSVNNTGINPNADLNFFKNFAVNSNKFAYKLNNDFDTAEFFQTASQFIDLKNINTLYQIKNDIKGKTNSIKGSKLGEIIYAGQTFLTSEQIRSIGVGVCYDASADVYCVILLCNPLAHLDENFGQLGLLYSITRAITLEDNQKQVNLNNQIKGKLQDYWKHLLYDVTIDYKRLTKEYGVGDGQNEKEPLEALIPYWKSIKPNSTGLILTSLADNFNIPLELRLRKIRKKDAEPDDESDNAYEDKRMELSIRRYFGDTSVLACFGWKKEEFEELLKVIELNKPENEIIGSAFGSGYYWIEKLLEEAKLLQFIKSQKLYHKSNWEDSTNPYLSKLLYDLSQNAYHVMLQPQVELQQEEGREDWFCHGAEALIRRSDNSSFPDEFVPLFEEQGIVRHIDLFVMETICKNLQSWKKEYNRDMQISVNLSRVTLLEPNIVQSVVEICDKYEVDHGKVIIEVTERVGLIPSEVSPELVQEFRDAGYKISLDDFGSDTSNLAALSKLSVDEVKVDKGLVDHIANFNKDHNDYNKKIDKTTVKNKKIKGMVKKVINMCDDFDYDTMTLAEGIENIEQAITLREFKCKYGQGYYFSKPISIDDFFEKYIK